MAYGVSGTEIKAAFKKAATWGTAVACGAGDGILIQPTSIKKDASPDVDDSLGAFFPKDGLLGAIKVEGEIPCYLRYDSLDVLIALAMGTAGAPVRQAATSAYAFTYKPATGTDGLFGTFAEHMKNFIQENQSVKVTGFTIKGEVGKALTITFKVVAINEIIDSTINTTTTFNSVTFTETANRVKFSEGIFRMSTQSGAALGSGDKIYPSSFEFSFQRKLKGEYGQYRYTNGANSQDLIDEPTNDGMPEISLKLEFPRLTGTTNLAILGADTRQKMDIAFTGGLIASTYYRGFTLQFPHLQLINDSPADAAGIIKEPLEFRVYGCAAPPLGMGGIYDPFWVTGTNQRTTDPLA